MAYIKTSTTRNLTAALRYGEHEKSVVRGAVNCPADTELARKLMTADVHIFGKTDGVQGHVIVQSFDDDVSPQVANEIGCRLAEKIAPGHRAMVYTHSESKGGKVHNHVVISAVNPQTGLKLDHHNLWKTARAVSDELCKEYGLSVIPKQSKARMRYTQAEAGLVSKGKQPWKDELREVIEHISQQVNTEAEFLDGLKRYGVTVSERQKKDGTKQWTYQHPNGRTARGRSLGDDYTREGVLDAVSKQKETALERFGREEQERWDATRKRLEQEEQQRIAEIVRHGNEKKDERGRGR